MMVCTRLPPQSVGACLLPVVLLFQEDVVLLPKTAVEVQRDVHERTSVDADRVARHHARAVLLDLREERRRVVVAHVLLQLEGLPPPARGVELVVADVAGVAREELEDFGRLLLAVHDGGAEAAQVVPHLLLQLLPTGLVRVLADENANAQLLRELAKPGREVDFAADERATVTLAVAEDTDTDLARVNPDADPDPVFLLNVRSAVGRPSCVAAAALGQARPRARAHRVGVRCIASGRWLLALRRCDFARFVAIERHNVTLRLRFHCGGTLRFEID
mmetsp:Transcript_49540/g.152900  ORF Transcript_49540/g.152900 Transcript_49540/m.152900 type:complete len:276 (-) Transcript_49540:2346-3173(-)